MKKKIFYRIVLFTLIGNTIFAAGKNEKRVTPQQFENGVIEAKESGLTGRMEILGLQEIILMKMGN